MNNLFNKYLAEKYKKALKIHRAVRIQIKI